MYLHTLTVSLLLALSSTSTPSLLCDGIRSPSAELRRATAVFSGEAISQEFVESKDESVRALGGGALITKFKVRRWWKGSATKEITIHTSAQRMDGGISMLAEVVRFKVGEEYIVYAFGSAGELWNGLCSRTAGLKGTEEDLHSLGAGYAPQISSLHHPMEKPNNGMHPTPNQQFCYQSQQQGAGDAGRQIAVESMCYAVTFLAYLHPGDLTFSDWLALFWYWLGIPAVVIIGIFLLARLSKWSGGSKGTSKSGER